MSHDIRYNRSTCHKATSEQSARSDEHSFKLKVGAVWVRQKAQSRRDGRHSSIRRTNSTFTAAAAGCFLDGERGHRLQHNKPAPAMRHAMRPSPPTPKTHGKEKSIFSTPRPCIVACSSTPKSNTPTLQPTRQREPLATLNA